MPALLPLNFERLEVRRLLTVNCEPTITIDGDTAIIVGSAENDTVELLMGTATHQLDFSGFQYTFDASEIREIRIGGGGGTNSVRIVGTALDDRGSAIDLNATLTSSTYSALTFSFQASIIDGGSGGNDYAQIYGSMADDTMQGLPDQTVLTTPTTEITAANFGRIDAYGRAGDDYAQVYGTQQADHFAATEDYTLLTGPGINKYTKGFERVDAFGRGGADLARLLGSSRSDSFVVGADYAYLNNGQRLSYSKGFEDTEGTAIAGGTDQAFYLDVTANDSASVAPNQVTLQRGQIGYEARMTGMDTVTLRDTAGDTLDDQLAELAQLLGDLEPYLPAATLDDIASSLQLNRSVTTGTANGEELLGGNAADEINSGAGNDVVYGLAGNDLIRGQEGNDSMDGMDDNDLIFGGQGHDELRGGNGSDVLLGGPGNDIVDGELGTDYVSGGEGNDVYRFTSLDEIVVITDYDPSQDRIELINIQSNEITLSQTYGFMTVTHPDGLQIILLGIAPSLTVGDLNLQFVTSATQTLFDPNA